MNPVVENDIKRKMNTTNIMIKNIFININRQTEPLFWSNVISH